MCACICVLLLRAFAAKMCTSVPPTAANNAAAWNTTACAGKLVGGTCSAACLSSATGAGYVATCTGDNTWNVTGSCTGDWPAALLLYSEACLIVLHNNAATDPARCCHV
jgi:hypothetical protein